MYNTESYQTTWWHQARKTETAIFFQIWISCTYSLLDKKPRIL